jgi:Uma2 family endonuclease
MAQPRAHTPPVLSRDEFRRWAEAQPRGRYERIAGRPVAMAPERGAHLRAKSAIWLALRQAIAAAGVPCEALPDGATVEIGDETDYEPDALVTCGARMADDAIAAPGPVIVVEVMSPSTRSR